jgi:hypothetical protein
VSIKKLYLTLCVVGPVLPCWQLIPFLREHGPDLRLLVEQLFSNRIGGFFGLDVIVSSLVLWVFILVEGARERVPYRWVPVLGSLTVGVSLGLPLFLYMREARAEASGRSSGSADEGRP